MKTKIRSSVKLHLGVKTTMIFIFLILLFTLNNCSGKRHSKRQKLQLYYINSSGVSLNNLKDTVSIKKASFHYITDSLYSTAQFVIDNRVHNIRRYSNLHLHHMDGIEFCYELDSVGIIYSFNTTWKNQSRLYTNSDSLNRIISYALSEIMFYMEVEFENAYSKTDKTVFFEEIKI